MYDYDGSLILVRLQLLGSAYFGTCTAIRSAYFGVFVHHTSMEGNFPRVFFFFFFLSLLLVGQN